jgi:outer membrane protein OmpA-like peptidoglycan-associated protein
MRAARSPGLLGLFALVVACLLLLERGARAEPTVTGFALDRYRPPEAGSDWFANESLDLRGSARPALSLVADIGYRPLVLFGPDGEELLALIDAQFFYHVNASVTLWHRLRLSASVPLLLYSQGGEGTLDQLGDRENVPIYSSDGSGIGDVRFGLDLRLAGTYGGPFSLAIGGRVYAATGSEPQFTSDGRARIEGRLMWAGQPGRVSYAAYVGILEHGEKDDFAGLPFGTDLTFGAALGLRLAQQRLHIGPEVYGETVISDSGDGFLKRATTPVEAAFGAKLRIADTIRIGAAVGRGVTNAIGASQFRALVVFDWLAEPDQQDAGGAEAAPARDLDGDGVADESDACPTEPGPVRSLDQARSGCPDPGDSDHDNITDDVDACKDQPGVPSADPSSHGCPPPDRDRDGVVDTIDACPDTPGLQTVDPLRSGCPADSDSDGINDAQDACPGVAGVRSRDPKRHGCPRARIEDGQIKIGEQVQFAASSARILPESDSLLVAVASILLRHAEIELLSVEGHTDSLGSSKANEKLSRDRAMAVVMRLVESGVNPRRLVAKGYGPLQPIDDNDTEAGRQNNRRVEFRILRTRADEGGPRRE